MPAALAFVLVVAANFLGTMPRVVGPQENLRSGPRSAFAPSDVKASFGDFRDTVWLPTRDLVSGGNPYDAPQYLNRHPYAFEFTYTPAQLLLFGPLAALPLYPASVVWFGALILGAIVIAALTLSAGRLPRRMDLLLITAAATLALRPMGHMVFSGQTSIVPLIGTAFALLRRKSDLPTTLAVAAAWLKPQFGIPLVVILLALNLRRPVLWGTAIAAVLSLPAVIWASISVGGLGPFLASLPRALDAALNSPLTRPTNGYVNPDLGSLLGHLSGDHAAGPLVLIGFAGVLGFGTFAVARGYRADGIGPLVATASAMTTVLLCLPHVGYDLVLVMPAFAVIVLAILQPARIFARAWLGVAALAMALTLFPVVVSGSDAERDVRVAMLILAVASLVMFDLLPGSAGRRVSIVALAVVAMLVLRYVVVLGTEDQFVSGLVRAWALLIAWAMLTLTAAFSTPTRQSGSDADYESRLNARLAS